MAESGKAAAATVLGSALFGADGMFAAPVKERRNVAGMGENDPILVSCRKAIKKMRALAKVAMARKLAVRLYWMPRSEVDYAQLLQGSHAGQLESSRGRG